MLAWVKSRWEEIRESWRETLHLSPPEYCVEGVPTSDEMAAKAARLEGELSLERVRRATAERDLAELRGNAATQGLTRAQMERLVMLAEECGEVQQAVGKVLRHGYESGRSGARYNNRCMLEREIGDLQAIVDLLTGTVDLRWKDIRVWRERRAARLLQSTHHQGLAPAPAAQAVEATQAQ